jgi:hypothetical protein
VVSHACTANEREGGLLQIAIVLYLPGFSFLLYIAKEVEAIGRLNQQTARIILMCDKVLMRSNRSHPRTSSITNLSCLHYAQQTRLHG